MKWSYGVTTVPSRFDELLPKTLKSLAKAGFEYPRLFVDSPLNTSNLMPVLLEQTYRDSIGTFGNWWLAAVELYLREPNADYYAIFQDDLIACKNLRQYIEKCPYPKESYLNLYTFPENETGKQGWYPSNQLGKGALGLVFGNEALRKLFTQYHFIDRAMDCKRGKKSVDGGVVTAMNKVGYAEWVHSPSLLQHTGLLSSMGNKTQPLAETFRGEDFNALGLLK